MIKYNKGLLNKSVSCSYTPTANYWLVSNYFSCNIITLW